MFKQAFPNGTRCPHCGSQCDSIRTVQVTPLYREVVYQCRNADCQCMFVASIVPVKTIFASKQPNQDVRMPGSVLMPAAADQTG